MTKHQAFVAAMQAAAVHYALTHNRGSDWVAAMVEQAWKAGAPKQQIADEIRDLLARERA